MVLYASKALFTHSMLSAASSSMASKRHGGVRGREARYCWAVRIRRFCLCASILAAAPPKSPLLRWRTSTKTRVSPSRNIRSIFPEAAVEIGLDQLQAALLQVPRCNLLGLSAGLHGRDLLSTGIPCPWRMSAGMPSRLNTCPVNEILPVTPSSGNAFARLL